MACSVRVVYRSLLDTPRSNHLLLPGGLDTAPAIMSNRATFSSGRPVIVFTLRTFHNPLLPPTNVANSSFARPLALLDLAMNFPAGKGKTLELC